MTTTDTPVIGVGLLGYGGIGYAHSEALKKLQDPAYQSAAVPRLAAVAEKNRESLAKAGVNHGYAHAYSDWRDLIADPAVQVLSNGGSNDIHAEPCIAAAQAGKHVFCEKPLARTAEEAKRMLDAVRKAGVKHAVAYNYRFTPGIMQMKTWLDQGALGRIFHFRAVYLQDWIMDPAFPKIWRLDKNIAGSGALGDLGSHIIDLARFLVGEPVSVMGMEQTFIKERALPDGSGRGPVDVDDAFTALLQFENGALGTVEASRFCYGHGNGQFIEVNGENGSIRFDLDHMKDLEVCWKQDQTAQRPTFERAPFERIAASDTFMPHWAAWEIAENEVGLHPFVREFDNFFRAIVNDTPVTPYGADFEDGYRNAVICDAIVESAQSGRRVDIRYD